MSLILITLFVGISFHDHYTVSSLFMSISCFLFRALDCSLQCYYRSNFIFTTGGLFLPHKVSVWTILPRDYGVSSLSMSIFCFVFCVSLGVISEVTLFLLLKDYFHRISRELFSVRGQSGIDPHEGKNLQGLRELNWNYCFYRQIITTQDDATAYPIYGGGKRMWLSCRDSCKDTTHIHVWGVYLSLVIYRNHFSSSKYHSTGKVKNIDTIYYTAYNLCHYFHQTIIVPRIMLIALHQLRKNIVRAWPSPLRFLSHFLCLKIKG